MAAILADINPLRKIYRPAHDKYQGKREKNLAVRLLALNGYALHLGLGLLANLKIEINAGFARQPGEQRRAIGIRFRLHVTPCLVWIFA
ncbi:MAG: hypothetical protein R8K46_08995 [Mariprofundaceae bacterium]